LRLIQNGEVDSFWMNPRTFGQNVCRLRTARKLTQVVLADRVAISRRLLQMIEAGTVMPGLQIAYKMKAFFRCSWDDLLGKS